MGDKQLKVNEIVHLAPFDGIGPPDVVQYLGKAGRKASGRAVVMGADRVPFTVEESELSHIPIVREQTQRLGAEVQAWRIFALKVARLLASPGAEDMAFFTNASDLPDLLECLRGKLVGDAGIEALKAKITRLEAENASLLRVIPKEYLPDPTECLLPAEKEMTLPERLDYDVTPVLIKTLFHRLASQEAESRRKAHLTELEVREARTRVAHLLDRAEDAEKRASAAMSEAESLRAEVASLRALADGALTSVEAMAATLAAGVRR